jgi:hypothetical protein
VLGKIERQAGKDRVGAALQSHIANVQRGGAKWWRAGSRGRGLVLGHGLRATDF